MKFQHQLFSIFLLVRIMGEALYNLVYKSQLFTYSSTLIILGIAYFFFLPNLINDKDKLKKIFPTPILMYLMYLFLRINFYDFNSIKFYLSEILVYFSFNYALNYSTTDNNFYPKFIKLITFLYKSIIVVGCSQLLIFFVLNGFNLFKLFIERPVVGVFAHQNIYSVFILPIFTYFFLKKKYLWSSLALISYIGSGNRSLIVYLSITSILIFLLKKNGTLKKIQIGFSIILILCVFGFLINHYSQISKETFWNSGTDPRLSGRSMVWRIDTWKYLVEKIGFDDELIFGKKIRQSYIRVGEFMHDDEFPPHNDYLMLLYDTGIIGILLYLYLASYIISLMYKKKAFDVLPMYVLILAFQLTGNFIFYSISIFPFILFGLEIGNKQSLKEIS